METAPDRSLLIIVVLFVVAIVLGPVIFYGLPVLFDLITRTDSLLLMMIIPLGIVGWVFGALYLVRTKTSRDKHE